MNEQGLQILAEVHGARDRGKSFLMNDGFLYLVYSQTDCALYFRCKNYRNGCLGKVTFYSNGLSVSSNAHNHDAADVASELQYRAQRHSIISQVNNSSLANFQDIFHDTSRLGHLANNPLFTSHRLLQSMLRAQRNILPKCQSLSQLSAVLSNPDFSSLTRIHISQDILYQGCAECNDGSHVILLMSRNGSDFLRIIPAVFVLHIPVKVDNLQQIEMCIVGGICENRMVPLAWILMQTCTQEAMLAAFQLLKSSLNQYEFSWAMCAPDIAASTFSYVFSVTVYPSLYDFINDIALFREAGSLSRNLLLKQVVQLCCALPLLPSDYLQVGIDVVKTYAMNFGEVIYSEAASVFHYIEEMWLKIPQDIFLISGNIDRTNIGCEQLKIKIAAKFFSSKPDFYSVIRYIFSQSDTSDRISELLLLGERIVPQVPLSLLQHEDLVALVGEVRRPSFSVQMAVQNFLLAVAEKIKHLLL